MALDDAAFLTFAMGEHLARFPRHYRYVKNHMWALPLVQDDAAASAGGDAGRWRFGLTEYAVRLLQDVYFLDWAVTPPADLASRAMIGTIESKKAESDLFSPLAGTLVHVHEAVLEEPSLINADPYGEGWLIEMQCHSPAAADELMTVEAYDAHLSDAWKVAQRTIKGQANE